MSNVFYKRNLAVPFFTQRDNTYIWQQKYKEDKIDDVTGKKTEIKDQPFGPKYPMAWRTCNITSLCMILHYWGITKETPNQMIKNVFEKTEDGWNWLYEETVEKKNETRKGAARLENWDDLKKVAELYIKNNEEKEDYKVIQGTGSLTMQLLHEQIAKGSPVIISTGLGSVFGSGDTDGHIVVVRGFTDNDDVILNDPFGIPVDNDNRIRQTGTNSNTYGWYYLSEAASVGDNIIIDKDDFASRYAKNTSKYLYIEGPLWQLPGGTENDSENCYPIKTSNFWHNGIHLQSSDGFYSIGSGRLIAARNSEVKNHGSSSFALVKYQMPEKQNQFFYALYMHLKKIDLAKELKNFFLENHGNLSNELKGTWYEQIFNNLLPYYKIISHKVPKQISTSDYNKIFKANLKDLTLTHTDFPTDILSDTGLLSRHAKLYLLPVKPELLKKISEIENYNNFATLKFMVKANKSDFIDADGYYYFFCGNNGQKQLCCCKNSLLQGETEYRNFATYDKLNEASYKDYTAKLYNLYTGNTVIFNKIDTTEKTKIENSITEQDLFEYCIYKRIPSFTESDKFGIRLCKQNNESDYAQIEHCYSSIEDEIKNLIFGLEQLFYVNVRTGKSADYNKISSMFDNYVNKRRELISALLKKISGMNEKRELKEETDALTDIEWMKLLFKDAEKIIDSENILGLSGKYDSTTDYKEIRKEFFNLLNEYQNFDVIKGISICEYLMLEFISIQQIELKNYGDNYFKFNTCESNDKNTSKTLRELFDCWNNFFKELKNTYKTCFKIRYIDNFIEIPKGSIIGKGTQIPDSGKEDSIHFEIFSKDNLLDNNVVISDDDENNFYNPKEITKKLLDGISISDEEKRKIIKYADDYVIRKDEIKEIYSKKNIFQKLVVRHQSEWKTRKYTEDDIKSITASEIKINKKNEKEIVKTLDYMNDYYGKYNWLDREVEKELNSKIFHYYHPIYFITEISKKD